MTEIKVNVGGELFEFTSFVNWCNTAKRKFTNNEVKSEDVICVDAKGRICEKGKEFMRARDENTFPIKAYKILIELNI